VGPGMLGTPGALSAVGRPLQLLANFAQQNGYQLYFAYGGSLTTVQIGWINSKLVQFYDPIGFNSVFAIPGLPGGSPFP